MVSHLVFCLFVRFSLSFCLQARLFLITFLPHAAAHPQEAALQFAGGGGGVCVSVNACAWLCLCGVVWCVCVLTQK